MGKSLLEETVKQTYQFLDGHEFEPNDPEMFNRVAGTIDLHLHAGPQRQPYLPLGRQASKAGMTAMVLKDHALGSTVDVAARTNDVLESWASDVALVPTRMLGSVIIKKDSPLDWASYVVGEVARGARVVWLPVFDSANHMAKNRGVDSDIADRLGLSVLEGDNLSSQASELLAAIKECDVAVSFGHSSRAEMLELSIACKEMDIDKAFVDHPFSPATELSVADMILLARRGITLNFTYWEMSPYCGVPAYRIAQTVREVGIGSATLSSDSGMDILPNSVECMRLNMAMLAVYGFAPAEQFAVCGSNPARILSLAIDPKPQ